MDTHEYSHDQIYTSGPSIRSAVIVFLKANFGIDTF